MSETTPNSVTSVFLVWSGREPTLESNGVFASQALAQRWIDQEVRDYAAWLADRRRMRDPDLDDYLSVDGFRLRFFVEERPILTEVDESTSPPPAPIDPIERLVADCTVVPRLRLVTEDEA